VPPALERIRKARGPFASDDDLLLAAFYDGAQYQALKDAGPIKTEYPLLETPLLTLIKELSARPSIKGFQLQQT
jgi:oxaloacetate decarboxylase (Na+ extruding) subunit alpha